MLSRISVQSTVRCLWAAGLLFIATDPIRAAVKPYANSMFITGCAINPAVTSVGVGDCWPATWADDDNLYGFWNDGTGFGLPSGVSTYPYKMIGSPPNVAGSDISTNPIGTAKGGGASGRKVSGVICLNGNLYAWCRNMTKSGGSSMFFSLDKGANWKWAWGTYPDTATALIPELGYPTWVQRGKNNASATDNYVYFISPMQPVAYSIADKITLGRVHKDSILAKGMYAYFSGTEGHPQWSTDIARRTAVFTAPGQCYRATMTYDAPLQRYLLCTANGDRNSHPSPGHNLGIYESVNPWGPWSTVYWDDAFQKSWSAWHPQIIPKWISSDGKSFYLEYSNYSAGPYKFNYQQVTLTIPPTGLLPGTRAPMASGNGMPLIPAGRSWWPWQGTGSGNGDALYDALGKRAIRLPNRSQSGTRASSP